MQKMMRRILSTHGLNPKPYSVGLLLLMVFACSSALSQSRDAISVVGSSTVFPFSKVVAERFGRISRFKTPTIEQIGTGGGFKEFCRKLGSDSVDIVNASRRIKKSEFTACQENGVTKLIEIQIGYDGIVLANNSEAEVFALTRKEIFLALAKYVPDPDGSGQLMLNPYLQWNEINPTLPKRPIHVLGPSPSSGTRDTFVDMVMAKGCRKIPLILSIRDENPGRFREVCELLRGDGAYIEAGENDHLILQKLKTQPDAMGIFGFSFLDQNTKIVHAASIDGFEPSFESISSGAYPITRKLYFYVKKAHIGVIPGIKQFLREFTSEKAWGDEGYLAEKGLIPSSPAERVVMKQRIATWQELQFEQL